MNTQLYFDVICCAVSSCNVDLLVAIWKDTSGMGKEERETIRSYINSATPEIAAFCNLTCAKKNFEHFVRMVYDPSAAVNACSGTVEDCIEYVKKGGRHRAKLVLRNLFNFTDEEYGRIFYWISLKSGFASFPGLERNEHSFRGFLREAVDQPDYESVDLARVCASENWNEMSKGNFSRSFSEVVDPVSYSGFCLDKYPKLNSLAIVYFVDSEVREIRTMPQGMKFDFIRGIIAKASKRTKKDLCLALFDPGLFAFTPANFLGFLDFPYDYSFHHYLIFSLASSKRKDAHGPARELIRKFGYDVNFDPWEPERKKLTSFVENLL
jgi:hypothetical protein